MTAFIQQLAAGLATGCIYACLALALVMIYRATNHVNFAQGEMAMMSTYVAWMLIELGLPFYVVFPVTLVCAALLGLVIQYVIMGNLQHGPVLIVVVVFLALYMLFQSLAGLLFDYSMKTFDSPFDGLSAFSSKILSSHDIGVVLTTLAVLASVYSFFRFTSLGLAVRAVASNPVSSSLLGLNPAWLLSLGWAVAGAIGAVAGILSAPTVGLEPHMMSGVLVYGFAAAILGGIDSPLGAVVGGVALGIVENLAGAYLIGSELKLTFAMVAIFVVLILKPSGLFGTARISRV
jgi:branched-chain amino acid transport system permease protein